MDLAIYQRSILLTLYLTYFKISYTFPIALQIYSIVSFFLHAICHHIQSFLHTRVNLFPHFASNRIQIHLNIPQSLAAAVFHSHIAYISITITDCTHQVLFQCSVYLTIMYRAEVELECPDPH